MFDNQYRDISLLKIFYCDVLQLSQGPLLCESPAHRKQASKQPASKKKCETAFSFFWKIHCFSAISSSIISPPFNGI